jgi:hypothetical protein
MYLSIYVYLSLSLIYISSICSEKKIPARIYHATNTVMWCHDIVTS